MDIGALAPADRHVDGIVEMVLDATQRYDKSLTEERLFGWHAALFPTGYSGLTKITVGAYRKDAEGPMQVVSGGVGKEKVHFEAPPAERLEQEMARFIDWFNHAQGMDPTIKAGIAHLWFVTIHPFEDGNGRIGRAVCDMALARADGSSHRFYSLSAQIQRERKDYYDALEFAQKSARHSMAGLVLGVSTGRYTGSRRTDPGSDVQGELLEPLVRCNNERTPGEDAQQNA